MFLKKLNKNHIFPFLLLCFILVMQGPVILNNLTQQGEKFPKLEATNIETQEKFQLPNGKNGVIIFWATWCAPCKLEMNRLKKMVEDGDIKKEQIFAYNPFEDERVILPFLKDHLYPFQFITTSQPLEKVFQIRATPTYLWIKKDHVERMTTGISIVNLWWLDYFLSSN